jgi:hypothetical protein
VKINAPGVKDIAVGKIFAILLNNASESFAFGYNTVIQKVLKCRMDSLMDFLQPMIN